MCPTSGMAACAWVHGCKRVSYSGVYIVPPQRLDSAWGRQGWKNKSVIHFEETRPAAPLAPSLALSTNRPFILKKLELGRPAAPLALFINRFERSQIRLARSAPPAVGRRASGSLPCSSFLDELIGGEESLGVPNAPKGGRPDGYIPSMRPNFMGKLGCGFRPTPHLPPAQHKPRGRKRRFLT